MQQNIIIYLVIAILIVIVGTILVSKRHSRLIEEKIDALGGVLISCKRKFGLYNVGPYKWVGKNEVVYHIEYTLDSETKEGWVKFSLWTGADWRF